MLDAVRVRSGADDVVADGGAEGRRRIGRTVRFDGGDEELGDVDVSDIVDQPPQFRAKRASVERQIARQIRRPLHIERRLTRRGRCDRDAVVRRGNRDRAALPGRAADAPPRSASDNSRSRASSSCCLTLQREPVVPWFELFQKRLQGFRHREPGSMVGGLLDLRCSTDNADTSRAGRR